MEGSLLNQKYLNCSGYIKCPDCSTDIKVFDYTNSNHFGCAHCKTFFSRNHQIKGFVKRDFEIAPLLQLGSKATFDNCEYILAGFIIKRENGNRYTWREYLLINEKKGYAFLAEYNGHWNFIAGKEHFEDLEQVSDFANEAYFRDLTFKLFNKYEPVILYATGEFDWNILEDRITAKEYISPPLMLIKEDIRKTEEWYLATYKSASEIAEAFKIDASLLPQTFDVGANEPSKSSVHLKGLKMLSFWTAILLLIITLAYSHFSPEKTVFDEQYTLSKDSTNWGGGGYKTITTSSFNITGPTALNIQLRSYLDNHWMEVPVILINDKTGKFYEFTKAIEYYHGYEGGESWSEGGNEENAVLSNIPSGTYHMAIEPSSDSTGEATLSILVSQNTELWSNFFICLLIIAIAPVIQSIRNYLFETNRWANSDYSPYNHEE
ncbi:DUF4178 domain-containing protein [Solitalea sp. MAHUQ-68]|uniref:DUF4178 domain-containing protein n=1 Tax=Solitalea agri TaxID=2953739 RepID=A0A9X2F156_9SPHI|nr:DUF4178 domain-containing protein [Solitalea agri]MCO4292189.1 DUF4178 domain-containing protein [Solitalea agri]